MSQFIFRRAGPSDIETIAAIHANSWKQTYEKHISQDYLNGPLLENRIQVWTERLSEPEYNQKVVLLESQHGALGFICFYVDKDLQNGSFIDNLHVASEFHGIGAGFALMKHCIEYLRENAQTKGIYLEVLSDNEQAQRFYRRLGAKDMGMQFWTTPEGNKVEERLFAWKELPNF